MNSTKYNTIHGGRVTVGELIVGLLDDKQRVANARFRPRPTGVEIPREVFLRACEEISRQLDPHGFKFAKSGPRCTRRSGDLTFKLHFSSDYNNVAGEHVGLHITGKVDSRTYKRWSQEVGLSNPGSRVASGQLGYLCDEHLELYWELANSDSRSEVIAGAARAIEDIALPFFARFDDFERLRSDLQRGVVPMMDATIAIHFLMCFGTREEAVTVGRRFFKSRSDLVDAYRKELRKLDERQPLQIQGQGWAKELAIVSHFFELGDLTDL
jgi:hypothetical protein